MTPFGEAGVNGYPATTRCKEDGNGYPAGGLWVCVGQRPRWLRIFPMTAGCSMKAMARIGPPHWGQTKGSAS